MKAINLNLGADLLHNEQVNSWRFDCKAEKIQSFLLLILSNDSKVLDHTFLDVTIFALNHGPQADVPSAQR